MSDIEKVELRNLKIDDYDELKISMQQAYTNWPGAYWSESHIGILLNIFPEGQVDSRMCFVNYC